MSEPRPTCAAFIATSVDGFIARPDGAIDWLESVQREGEDYGYAEFFQGVDALVMGRNTYETVLGFDPWPYADKPVIVLTRRGGTPQHGARFTSDSPGEALAALGREGARRVYVDGGAVIRSFLAARLIDELTISVVPLVLGAGVPLFASGAPEQKLSLESSRGYPSGLVQLRYRFERSA